MTEQSVDNLASQLKLVHGAVRNLRVNPGEIQVCASGIVQNDSDAEIESVTLTVVFKGGPGNKVVHTSDVVVTQFGDQKAGYRGHLLPHGLGGYAAYFDLPKSVLELWANAEVTVKSAIAAQRTSPHGMVAKGDVAAVKKFLDDLPHDDTEGGAQQLVGLALVAASVDNVELVKLLKARLPQASQDPNLDGRLLNIAAQSGSLKTIEYLLSAGTPVDCLDRIGQTPLFYAARRDQVGAVKLLLAKGAKVDAQDLDQTTPLISCMAFGGFQAARELIAHGADKRHADGHGMLLIHHAVQSNLAEAVPFMLELGFDVNARQGDKSTGWTPLHYAVSTVGRVCTEALLAKGANPDAKDGKGNTPRSMASSNAQLRQLFEGR